MNYYRQIIKGAIDVLEKNGWSKGFAARNADGKPIHYEDSEACSFCAFGAMLVACASIQKEQGHDCSEHLFAVRYALDVFITRAGKYDSLFSSSTVPLFAFNDAAQSKEEVIALLNEFLETL